MIGVVLANGRYSRLCGLSLIIYTIDKLLLTEREQVVG